MIVDVLEMASGLRARGEPFALATVVRTVAATAAKPGAKAIVLSDGQITGGWIGGGCARGAVLRAAREAMADGVPRLVSIQPRDLLQEQGILPGEARDGIAFATSACPSRGTMDVFVEPMMPAPQLAVCGASPVAVAVAELAPRAGFAVTICAAPEEHARFDVAARLSDGTAAPGDAAFVVVATQGRGDRAALLAALATPRDYLAFVGSARKTAALRAGLAADGCDTAALAALRAPAGLDLGAITPEEIAFSILAEMIQVRRHGSRRVFGP